MKIGIRLITSLLILVLIIAISGYTMIINFDKIPISLNKTLFADMKKISKVTDLNNILQKIVYYNNISSKAIFEYAQTGTLEKKNLYHSANKIIDKIFKDKTLLRKDMGEEFFSKLINANNEIKNIEEEALIFSEKNNQQAAIDSLNTEKYTNLKNNYKQMVENYQQEKTLELNQIIFEFRETLQAHYDTTKDIIKFNQNIAIIVTIISLPIALMLGLYITISISNPLYKLQEKTKSISEGDLNTVFDINSQDEIGDLANAFNIMTQKLRIALAKEKEGIILKARAEAHQKKSEELEMLNEQLIAKEKNLQNMNDELEKSKQQLAQQIENLEKTNKSLIGREVRIIELKEEIQKLKEKFEEN